MRIHVIACRVLTRELSHLAAISPHKMEITWMPQGLHDTPNTLRDMLAKTMEGLYQQRDTGILKQWPDAIVLGYGLCSNGVLGLESRDTPLVIPRTDDCIALFLGSQRRYLQLFEQYSGCYWLNNGWIEHGWDANEAREADMRAEYARLYGEENADFLVEQDRLWIRNYRCCGYISSPVYENPDYIDLAQRTATRYGWDYVRMEGDLRMLHMLTQGDWPEEEFLICPPYHRIEAAYDGSKLQAVPI